MLTQEILKELFDYRNGNLYWKVANSKRIKVGALAGCVAKAKKRYTPYRLIRVSGKLYQAHRLVWLYVYGVWPSEQVDHIDGDGLNNHIENLRAATSVQNGYNRSKYICNSSGYKGVKQEPRTKNWYAYITVNKNRKYLGTFPTAEEASEAYQTAARALHGEFYRKP